MNTFFKVITLMVMFALSISFVTSTSAAITSGNVHWEGTFAKVEQQGDHFKARTRKGVTYFYAACQKQDGDIGYGWYCHTKLDGGGTQQPSMSVNVTTRTSSVDTAGGGQTQYAVFEPRHVRHYLGGGDNVFRLNNGTSLSNVAEVLDACRSAGGYCIIVRADSWHDAVAIAKRQTGWHL